MKVIAGILLLSVMAVLAEGYQTGKRCPSPKGDCICTLDYNPVCSTRGCEYANFCVMKCAGGTLHHRGLCNRKPLGK